MLRTRFGRALLIGSAGLALMLGAACTSDDDGAAPSGAGAAASAATADAVYPVEVTDLVGRNVTIDAAPAVIVTLSPTAAEFVAALGAPVAGRSTTTRYPPEVQAAADIGQGYQPNVESILALAPDLVVADGFVQGAPQLREMLEVLGAPVVFVSANSLEEVTESYRVLGQVLGNPGLAAEKIAGVEEARAAAAATVPEGVTAIILIADRDSSLYAAGADSWGGALLDAVGAVNVAAGQPDSGQFPGFVAVPIELLLNWDPDYVLAVTPAPMPAPRLSQLMRMIPALRGLTALQEGRVVDMDLELMLQAPGPRVVEALAHVAETVSVD